MLYTDLDNPTSNKIYAEVGYRRSGDWEEIALVRPDREETRLELRNQDETGLERPNG
jgi:hypothetical protein